MVVETIHLHGSTEKAWVVDLCEILPETQK